MVGDHGSLNQLNFFKIMLAFREPILDLMRLWQKMSLTQRLAGINIYRPKNDKPFTNCKTSLEARIKGEVHKVVIQNSIDIISK